MLHKTRGWSVCAVSQTGAIPLYHPHSVGPPGTEVLVSERMDKYLAGECPFAVAEAKSVKLLKSCAAAAKAGLAPVLSEVVTKVATLGKRLSDTTGKVNASLLRDAVDQNLHYVSGNRQPRMPGPDHPHLPGGTGSCTVWDWVPHTHRFKGGLPQLGLPPPPCVTTQLKVVFSQRKRSTPCPIRDIHSH